MRAEGSAVKGVADCRTDSAHRFPARGSNELGERCLGHRMEPVAVDGRFSVESVFSVVDRHLGCQTTHRACDLGDRDQCSDFEDFVACENQHRSPFSSDLGKPDLSSVHSSPQASASFQNWSGRSGRRSYASRSALARASRTAAATPSRAAAEMLIPSRRALSASDSSSVKVVRVVAISVDASRDRYRIEHLHSLHRCRRSRSPIPSSNATRDVGIDEQLHSPESSLRSRPAGKRQTSPNVLLLELRDQDSATHLTDRAPIRRRCCARRTRTSSTRRQTASTPGGWPRCR